MKKTSIAPASCPDELATPEITRLVTAINNEWRDLVIERDPKHIIFEGDWVLYRGKWAQVFQTGIRAVTGTVKVTTVHVHQLDMGPTWIDAEGRRCKIMKVMSNNEMQSIINRAIGAHSNQSNDN